MGQGGGSIFFKETLLSVSILTHTVYCTSWQYCRGYEGRLHDLALPPDGHHDEGVAGGDDQGREDEERESHEDHIKLPVPLCREVYPTLSPII